MSVTLEDDQQNARDESIQREVLAYLKVIAFILCEQQNEDLDQLLRDMGF